MKEAMEDHMFISESVMREINESLNAKELDVGEVRSLTLANSNLTIALSYEKEKIDPLATIKRGGALIYVGGEKAPF